RTGIGPLSLLNYVVKDVCQFGMLLQRREICPTFLQKESSQSAAVPGFTFVDTFADPIVTRNHNPVSFLSESSYPIDIPRRRPEFVLHVGKTMVRLHPLMQSAG